MKRDRQLGAGDAAALLSAKGAAGWSVRPTDAAVFRCMDTSGQRVAAAFSWMQERDVLRSRAGVRSLLVIARSQLPRRAAVGGVEARHRRSRLADLSDVYDRFVSAWLSWRHALRRRRS
jgi:hypothetical protein